MATIYSPVLLIGRERVAYIARNTGICAVSISHNCTERIVEVTCERYHQKGQDQSQENEDRNEVNVLVGFCWF